MFLRVKERYMKAHLELEGKRRFVVKVRDFEVATDLPEKSGGGNTAPTPSELFVSSLAACAGVYAASYLSTAGFKAEGLSIDVDWDMSAEGKKRIAKIDLTINVPNAELGERKRALLAAAEQCVIHNTLVEPPEIKISVS